MVERSVPVACVSVCVALFALGLLFLLAQLGGFLNRGRGGYVNLSDMDYWSAHILSRLLFAVPTGLMVLVFGAHARAAVIVAILTWFSLYVGWGVYFNIGIGDPGNYNTRSGVFDWLLGRQEVNWTFHHRFAREYAGMSLRGLVWTAPQGYALQQLGFGWEYSLSGSLMGLVYYLGKETPVPKNEDDFNKVFGAGTAYAEWYWGVWIWFVLLTSCLSQVVHRVHVWLYKHNRYQVDFKPFSTWEIIKYNSLNRSVTRWIYEWLMLLLNALFCCSVAFYSLITQDDLRNKGQTFFGMFTAVLFLTFSQGWVWGLLWLKWELQKVSKRSRAAAAMRYTGAVTGPQRFGRDLEHLDTAANNGTNSETQPLLSPSWPYANGERSSPRMVERQRTLNLPEGTPSHPHQQQESTHLQVHVAPANTSTALLILWSSMEKWMLMDIFVWTRRLIGIISILSTLLTIFMTIVATVWDWDSPRFLVASFQSLHNASNTTLFG